MTDNSEKYLGSALMFPIKIDSYGKVMTISGRALIPQSIEIILNDSLGNRYFLGEFGSQIPEMLFEPSDAVVKQFLIYYATSALADWEKRIKVESCTVEKVSQVQFNLRIRYRILASNEVNDFIYPYYIELKK